jgi:hypothetical protein
MAAFVSGDVAVGGVREYVQILTGAGVHSQFVHITDDLTSSGLQPYITGVTFRPPTGELFTTSTPDLTQDGTPHHCCWVPDDSGILVAVVPSTGVLKFRLYDYSDPAVMLTEWTPDVETGWGKQLVRISVACDSATVFYTMSLKSVKRFNIQTGLQMTDYQTLPPSSPYIFGSVRALPGPDTGTDDQDAIFPMTLSGAGPQRDLALAPGATFWNTIDNPSDGIYRIEKRLLLDRSVVTPPSPVETDAEPGGANDVNLSLAVYFNPCIARRRVGYAWVVS